MKERIRLAKSTNEQAHIEDESSDNDNSEAIEIIDDANDDIGNNFYLIKSCWKYILTLMNILLVYSWNVHSFFISNWFISN